MGRCDGCGVRLQHIRAARYVDGVLKHARQQHCSKSELFGRGVSGSVTMASPFPSIRKLVWALNLILIRRSHDQELSSGAPERIICKKRRQLLQLDLNTADLVGVEIGHAAASFVF